MSKDSEQYILETDGLVKTFPGVTALDNVNMKIKQGEIRALVGENGAGKSTLCNIITGIYNQDKGDIYILGNKVDFNHPKEALAMGIRMVYQERNLIPFMTGAQSICLGLEKTRSGFMVDNEYINSLASSVKEEMGLDIPLDVPVKELSPAQQQLIEILRATVHKPKLLILDEPTASLTENEVEILFKSLRKLKDKNVSMIYISHKIDEIYSLADSISVLRNGKKVYTGKCSSLGKEECIEYMVGSHISDQYPDVQPKMTDSILLKADNISDEGEKVNDVSIKVKKGEVVGIYGLVGSGRTEFANVLYGLRSQKSGDIIFNGEKINKVSPSKMIDRGLFLVPEDRNEAGLFPNFYLKENLTVYLLEKMLKYFNLIDTKKEERKAKEIAAMEDLQLEYTDLKQNVDKLSGGNQQKVVIGRSISQSNIQMLLMDEPTQGIDVGVKHHIYVLMRELAGKGIGTLFISSELPELIGTCDRMYVFKEGSVVGELKRKEFNQNKIMEMVL